VAKQTIEWIERDWVSLGDVELAAVNSRAGRTRESVAYRDRLIAQCYQEGDVTWGELAWAAHLSVGSIRRIVAKIEAAQRSAAEPNQPPWPTGELHVVRDES
jgi:hypothetical protein